MPVGEVSSDIILSTLIVGDLCIVGYLFYGLNPGDSISPVGKSGLNLFLGAGPFLIGEPATTTYPPLIVPFTEVCNCAMLFIII